MSSQMKGLHDILMLGLCLKEDTVEMEATSSPWVWALLFTCGLPVAKPVCLATDTLFEPPGETSGSFAFSSLSCTQAQAPYSVCSALYTPHSLLCHCYSSNLQRVLNPWGAFYWETEVIYKDLNSVK